MYDDFNGLIPPYDNQFDGYALLLRITQRTRYGLINLHALVPFTGDDVRYNAWFTIARPASKNNCALNLSMLNEMLRDFYRGLYQALRNAFSTTDLTFDYICR